MGQDERIQAGFDFSVFEVLTFDCYGTLIDWERGLLDAIHEVLDRRGLQARNEELLEAYAREEADLEKGDYLPYKEILRRCVRALGDRFGFSPSDDEAEAFAKSVGDWPPFDDSAEALARLSTRFRLGVITNCDDDLFARSNERLRVTFDWVVTAEQVGSYKPSRRNFEVALERIGTSPDRVLHVAQSLYHDHVPAKRMGLFTVWVDRRRGKEGFGATPPASVAPDVIVPDMRSLAEVALRDFR
ncbi:MAG TPA: haloacid dehalogenase type II [Actinomycetota bacterium]|nr:haloacid dehalogenase type II [Actinomycetota bacterium]